MRTMQPKNPEHAAAIVAGALSAVNIARYELSANPAALTHLPAALEVRMKQIARTVKAAREPATYPIGEE